MSVILHADFNGPLVTEVEVVVSTPVAKLAGDYALRAKSLITLAVGTGATEIHVSATGLGFPFAEVVERIVRENGMSMEVVRVYI